MSSEMSSEMSIGAASAASGVKVPTIRFYEEIGLMPSGARTQSGRRLYDEAAVRRLAFIRHARELGFDIDSIRALLALQDDPGQSCRVADEIARARLNEVDRRIASLTALKQELERMITGCAHGKVEDCRVIESLADHSTCRHHGSV